MGWIDMRDIVFVSLMGFVVVWTVLSAYGMIQAIGGFSDTYASLVASYPTLATDEARQRTLETVILYGVLKWAIVAVPVALVALLVRR